LSGTLEEKTMLMLSKATEVPRSALRGIATPPPTDTWRPVAHADVVDVVTERAAARGLRIKDERYAIMNGHLRLDGSLLPPVELAGARMFGSLDFEAVPNVEFPSGCVPSMGLRNSHDKSFALSVLSGARVLVCANGVLSGEFVITRKHTSRIDLVQSVEEALSAFMDSARQFSTMQNRLVRWSLSDRHSKALVVDMAREGAFAPSEILKVLDEYAHPEHREFVGRNAWSLYNCATARMKGQSPARQTDGFRALSKVLWEAAPALQN
jgi:hypothetical protein